jgi:hypothetical protein
MALPRDDEQRVAKYNAKTAPTTVSLKVAARLTGMKSDFQTFCMSFTDMQLLVRGELAKNAAIFPLQYGGYYAYAAELWKLVNTTAQPALDATAQTVATKWTTRGLVCSMLEDIAFNVFSITIVCPGTP